MFFIRELDSSQRDLYIGGVDTLRTLTDFQGQINSHDFVGCMRAMQIENSDLLALEPIAQGGVIAGCVRAPGVCAAQDACGAGTCVDNWSQQDCDCPVGKAGDNCQTGELAMY